jgi:molecular chaperone DnaK
MVKDAEMHAEEDHKRRESAEARNHLDSLVYQTEKNLKEHGDQVDAAERANIEEALSAAKTALEGQDAEPMRAAMEKLTSAQHKLAEAMYAKAAQQKGGAEGGGDSTNGAGPGAQGSGRKDDVVDADFEEVKE